jgi:hypothetical protein
MLILGPVIDQEQNACRGQPVDEDIKKGLRFVIQPLQVFKENQEGLVQTLSQ